MIRPAPGETWRVELTLSELMTGTTPRSGCLVLSSALETRSDSHVVWRCLVLVPGLTRPVAENLAQGYDTRLGQ